MADQKPLYYAFAEEGLAAQTGLQVLGKPLDHFRILLNVSHQVQPKGYGCKGTCHRHYPDKVIAQGRGKTWVKDGKRYCSKCEFVAKTSDRNCKCCGNNFRIKPRRSSSRKTWKVFEGY